MSLLNQHREELLAMALGEVDERSRRKLQDLIESDSDCRDYWNDILELIEALSGEAASADKRKPSPWLHARVRSAILKSRKDESESVGRPWNFIRPWNIAFAAPVAALLVWWVISVVINDSMTKDPKMGADERIGEPGMPTLVALRRAADGSAASLDELLGDVLHQSSPAKQPVIYRAFDGRTAELPSGEFGRLGF